MGTLSRDYGNGIYIYIYIIYLYIYVSTATEMLNFDASVHLVVEVWKEEGLVQTQIQK